MKKPNLIEERKIWKRGINIIAGIDEAGRGPLAGPVVAAAVFLKKRKICFDSIKDSKKISPKKRVRIYNILIQSSYLEWGIGAVSEKVIDQINILEATKKAMRKAVLNLEKKIYPQTVDFLLIDGNFKINFDLCQKSISRGDSSVYSISLASIIAKVTRDQIMEKYHKQYPLYQFQQHKGYGTKQHRNTLKKYGPCKIHRKTFSPVSGLIDKS